METIELGPAGQDGDAFNAVETGRIWKAIDGAADGKVTGITLSGGLAATIGPPVSEAENRDMAALAKTAHDAVVLLMNYVPDMATQDLSQRQIDLALNYTG